MEPLTYSCVGTGSEATEAGWCLFCSGCPGPSASPGGQVDPGLVGPEVYTIWR